jgi:diadenosine tetraphosphate (Ap4A) HIT family hydrolase
MDNFSKYKIKDYKYWSVYIFQSQNYLGRCVIWCKRENAIDLTEATDEERAELFFILNKMKEALKNIFRADWFNYAFLGNETKHLHCHFIPRYASERNFGGVVFKDERWGKNYKTNKGFVISDELLEKIKIKIKENLAV